MTLVTLSWALAAILFHICSWDYGFHVRQSAAGNGKELAANSFVSASYALSTLVHFHPLTDSLNSSFHDTGLTPA